MSASQSAKTSTDSAAAEPARVNSSPAQQHYSREVMEAYDEYLLEAEKGLPVDFDAFATPFPTAVREPLRLLKNLHEERDVQAAVEEELKARGELVGLRPGDTIQGFTLQQELGRGAFARVFLATEPALGGRRVVVKLSRMGPDEALMHGRLSHPNIVPVYSATCDVISGLTAICMPYLGRSTLHDVLRRAFAGPGMPRRARVIVEAAQAGAPSGTTPLPAARLLRHGTYVEGILHLAAQMADALASVHAQGVCHQDLKPSNVLLSPDGRPLLLDFNLSRPAGPGKGRVGGTLPYMSPEQLRTLGPEKDNPPPRDARSDLFGLGVILYELLTGQLPFGTAPPGLPEEGPCLTLLERQRRGPRPLRELNPAVDRDAARLIERCLAYDPAARPDSAAEVAAAFRRCLRPARRVGRWLALHPWSAAAAVLLTLTLAGVGVAAQALAESPAARESRLGRAAFQKGEYQQAISHFNEALKLEDNQPEVLLARGWALQRLGGAANLGSARADYREAAELLPDGRGWAGVAYCLSLQGEYAAAQDIYEKALQEGFDSAEVRNNLAFCYLRREPDKLREVQRLLDRALADHPKLQAAYFNRAQLGYQEALACLSKYDNAQRRHLPSAAPLRAELEKRLVHAYRDAGKALELGPASVELCRLTAWICALGVKQDDKWVGPCLTYLKQAVDAGADQSLLSDLLFTPLRGRDDFQELLKRAPAHRRAAAATLRLAEPILEPAS
jgi:serine/threonine protein kinase/Tfp pilus assembly protein PilF